MSGPPDVETGTCDTGPAASQRPFLYDDETIAQRLRDADTREQAVFALERTEPIDPALALAAAPALAEVLALDAAQLARRQFEAVSLLLALYPRPTLRTAGCRRVD